LFAKLVLGRPSGIFSGAAARRLTATTGLQQFFDFPTNSLIKRAASQKRGKTVPRKLHECYELILHNNYRRGGKKVNMQWAALMPWCGPPQGVNKPVFTGSFLFI